jgi:translation initiation factor IF-1
MSGLVEEVLPSTLFRVKIGEEAKPIICTLSGKMRQNKIRVLLGDSVLVEVSPYDLTRGRITRRK